LNQVENIWARIKAIVSTKYQHIVSQPRLIQEIVLEIWNSFPVEGYWDNLILSIIDHVKADIKAKGGSTHY